jgi:hypothetical protein
MNVTHRLTFYQGLEKKPKFRINSFFNLIVLASLVMLLFIIRYTRLKEVSNTIDLAISIAAIVLFLILAYYQLGVHKKMFPVSLVAINRGVVMNYVMLYAIFDSTIRFKFNTLMLVYTLYLVGFELGPALLKKAPKLALSFIVARFSFGIV